MKGVSILVFLLFFKYSFIGLLSQALFSLFYKINSPNYYYYYYSPHFLPSRFISFLYFPPPTIYLFPLFPTSHDLSILNTSFPTLHDLSILNTSFPTLHDLSILNTSFPTLHDLSLSSISNLPRFIYFKHFHWKCRCISF